MVYLIHIEVSIRMLISIDLITFQIFGTLANLRGMILISLPIPNLARTTSYLRLHYQLVQFQSYQQAL